MARIRAKGGGGGSSGGGGGGGGSSSWGIIGSIGRIYHHHFGNNDTNRRRSSSSSSSRSSSTSWGKLAKRGVRITAVILLFSYVYMFIKVDHAFDQASWYGSAMERQMEEMFMSSKSSSAASTATSSSSRTTDATTATTNNNSTASTTTSFSFKNTLAGFLGMDDKTTTTTTTDKATSTGESSTSSLMRILKEQHAQEKERLEKEITRLREEVAVAAANIPPPPPPPPPAWDEISFQINNPEQKKRDLTGEDVRDIAVPAPRNLRLAFAGDSLTRYQYLSLAHFLRFGEFPDPSARPNFVVETTHQNWMEFYNFTNAGLLPFEKCDCYRPETKDIRRLVTEVRENRYFYDPMSGNSLTYLMKWGWHKMTLTWEPNTIHDAPPQFTPRLPEYLPPALPLEGDWVTVIDHLANLNPRPNVVVLNSGLWKPKELRVPEIQDIVVQKLKQYNMVGIYKTTTKRLGDEHPTENLYYEKQLCEKMICLDSAWTDYISPSMYWDNLHFVEPIYKRLNIQLLQLLKQHQLLDTYEPKFSPVLTGVKPLYGVADDKTDPEQLPHPHAGARFPDGKLGLVVNPDPRRMNTIGGERPLACPKGPFPGIEEDGGYDAIQRIRQGLLESRVLIQEKSSLEKKSIPRILCMVYTHEGAHDRLQAIANTWGKDCDGFFAASTKTDHSIGAIHLLHKGDESYENMWQKARSIWAYAYDYYKDDYDYFHLCGDDAFVIPDNLRAYAMSEEVKRLQEGYVDAFNQKIPWAAKTARTRPRPLLFGAPHFRSGAHLLFPDGGPGYTFNRAALDLFATDALVTALPDERDPREDVFVGGYFKSRGTMVTDTRDAEGGARYIDTDLDHQSKVDGIRGLSRLQPASLEKVFGIKWTYLMPGISPQTIAIHVKWSNFAEDMPGVIYRYYEMLHYDESRCKVAKG